MSINYSHSIHGAASPTDKQTGMNFFPACQIVLVRWHNKSKGTMESAYSY